MISLPLQNDTLFGAGPHGDTADVLDIERVLPFTLGDRNLISRTIAPVLHVPDMVTGPGDTADRPQGNDGGFGAGLDLSWSWLAGSGYRVDLPGSDSYGRAGFRMLHLDYEDGGFRWDVTCKGPLIGLTMRF